MATYDVTTANASLEFDTQYNNYNTITKLDDSHFFLTSMTIGNDALAQVFTVNTSTWAVTTANSSFVFDTVNFNYGKSTIIDTNHFLVLWDGNEGKAQVLTVNTSTWAVTTANSVLVFDTVSGGGGYFACQIDANHFLAFWEGTATSDGQAQVFEINTTTWAVTTAGSILTFETGRALSNICYKMDDSHYLNLWGYSNAVPGYAQVFTVNTSTWAVTTVGAKFQFDSAAKDITFKPVDSNHFVVFYMSDGTDGFVNTLEVNTSTWAITTASTRLEFDTVAGFSMCCETVDTNHFINFYAGDGSDGFVEVFEVNTSTWAVTTVNATRLEFDTAQGTVNGCTKIDTSHFIDAWTTTGPYGRIQVFTVELTPPTPAGSNSIFITGKNSILIHN